MRPLGHEWCILEDGVSCRVRAARRKLHPADMVEFQNEELKKRTRCIRVFPDMDSLLRVAAVFLREPDGAWRTEGKACISRRTRWQSRGIYRKSVTWPKTVKAGMGMKVFCVFFCVISCVLPYGFALNGDAIEGTVVGISPMPDPEQNDYANCNYAVMLKAPYRDEKMILVIPVMRDFKILPQNIVHAGDKLSCTVDKYYELPEKIRQVQLSDAFQSFDVEYFYSDTISSITSFSKKSDTDTGNAADPHSTRQVLPACPEAQKQREASMVRDLARIDHQLQVHGGSYGSWQQTFSSYAKELNEMNSTSTANWFGDSFFAAGAVSFARSPVHDAFIRNIRIWSEKLKERNIDLILVRVPSKYELTSDLFSKREIENPYWNEFMAMALHNGIEIIDPIGHMVEVRYDYPLMYFYHIPNEGHPHEGASIAIADCIAERLTRYPEYGIKKIAFKECESRYQEQGERTMNPNGNNRFPSTETSRFRAICAPDGSVPSIEENTGAPVLFISNSYAAYPSRLQGASVPHYVMQRLGNTVDWFYQDGIGNGMLNMLLKVPRLLDNRRAVVMILHPNQWGEDVPEYYDGPGSRKELFTYDLQVSDNNGLLHFAADSFFRNESSMLTTQDAPLVGNADILVSVPDEYKNRKSFLRLTIASHNYATIKFAAAGDKNVAALSPSHFESYVDFRIPADTSEIALNFHITNGRNANRRFVVSKISLMEE